MISRWSRDQVLALAPDAGSIKAAQSVGGPGKWSGLGVTAEVLWGECKGSGATPYRACVDLTEPAYRCSCPSRKFPCKHALGLLLLWSADGVPAATDDPPDWVQEWLARRRERAAKAAAAPEPSVSAGERVAAASGAAGERPRAGVGKASAAAARRAAQREERVTAGLSELERWLTDQVAQGVAGVRQSGQWDELARRLIDAQAPGVAGVVSRLPELLRSDDWPSRLLEEYGLLYLLATGHRRAAELPGPLRETIRSRVGFPVTREDVLAGPRVRDRWHVLGRRDEEEDRLVARRVWLRGEKTGRPALALTFAPIGQALDASLVTGTTVDADLAFYPGSAPLRAVVAHRHAPVEPGRPHGAPMRAVLEEVAAALAADPWTESWPVVLDGVVPARPDGRLLVEPESGEGLPLHPDRGVPWRLIAVSGGHPVTVAAEWTPRGLRPLTTWDEEGQVVIL